MKYFTSHFGAFLVVGLVGLGSEEDRALAENLFDVFTHDDVFHGRINFLSKRQFMKFLIYKELFPLLLRGIRFRPALSTAAVRARRVMENDVTHNAFMQQLPETAILDDYLS